MKVEVCDSFSRAETAPKFLKHLTSFLNITESSNILPALIFCLLSNVFNVLWV